MAVNLKLEIFRIALKKKGGRNSDLKNFKEFFDLLNVDKPTAYNAFIEKFLGFFGSEFTSNSDGTKGISANSSNQYDAKPSANVINGELFGGTLGNEHTVYGSKDSNRVKGKIGPDEIAALPFFFKLWTPSDYTTGVLMIQSYSGYSMSKLIKNAITKFFNKEEYSLLITPFIPEVIREEYLKKSMVHSVTILKDSLTTDKRRLLNPMFTEFEDLRVAITISGFKEDVATFWPKFMRRNKNNSIIGSNLEDFDIKEEQDYELKAHYIDEEGHKANISMSKDKKVAPTIFLPEALKKRDSNHFDSTKIRKHTDYILKEIQKEINYR